MAHGQPAGEEVYRPEVTPEDQPRKMVPEIRSAPLATGVEALTTTLAQKYTADSATYASNQLAQFRSRIVDELRQMQGAVPAGEDPGDFRQKFLAHFDQQASPLADAAGGNFIARGMVNKGLDDLRNHLYDHVGAWEAAQRVAFRTDSVRTNIKSQADVVEAHPELANSVGVSLMGAINSIGGEPHERLALAREMDAQVSLAAGYGLSRQDPRGTLEALKNPDTAGEPYGTLAHLTDAQREMVRSRAQTHLGDSVAAALSQNDIHGAQHALNANADLMDPRTFETLQRSVLTTEEHGIVMSEKFQKVASDGLAKQGDALLASGKLTTDWIEKNTKALEANQVRYFYKALSGTEESATNPKVYADLFLRGAQGQDVRDEARTALITDHTLSRADFTKIAGLVDQERPGWFKRGSQFLSLALDPGQLNPDPDAHQSRAFALQDWQEWGAKHPDATDAQAKAMQDEIAEHYRMVAGEKIPQFGLPAPTHLIGTRVNPLDEQGKPDPMLNATVRRANEALRNGEITQEERMQEARIIEAYREAYRQRQAAAAAKAKKANP